MSQFLNASASSGEIPLGISVSSGGGGVRAGQSQIVSTAISPSKSPGNDRGMRPKAEF